VRYRVDNARYPLTRKAARKWDSPGSPARISKRNRRQASSRNSFTGATALRSRGIRTRRARRRATCTLPPLPRARRLDPGHPQVL